MTSLTKSNLKNKTNKMSHIDSMFKPFKVKGLNISTNPLPGGLAP